VKLQDFGFKAVPGSSYTVTFTTEGKLIKTLEYNGTPITDLKLPDRTKVTISITDRTTGKQVFENDLYQYNGKLYNAIIDLPLNSGNNNMNANVYVKDMHYDLPSGNILIGVQGFKGEAYSLAVADITINHKVITMPITMQDNTYYSLATEMVQGNRFKVTLSDSHNVPLDEYDFTAPMTTSYRYNGAGVKELNTIQAPTAAVTDNTNAVPQTVVQPTPTIQPVQTQIAQQPIQLASPSTVLGVSPQTALISLIALLAIIFVILILLRKKLWGKPKEEEEEPYEEEEEHYENEEERQFQAEAAATSEEQKYVEPMYEEADPSKDNYDPKNKGASV
jgi:hypothetical protein